MKYWLVKSEPDVYPWAQLKKDKKTDWTGVRNFAARLHLLAMAKGDQVLFYHSNEGKEIVGLAQVTKTAFPDATVGKDEKGDWVAVELAPLQDLTEPVTLAAIKQEPVLKDMLLVRQGRLSVSPVTEKEFAAILKMGKTKLK
jgi:predicted RNA-binding protein with PUA-like domain